MLTGNFSRLILNNAALRKPFVYWGRQMIIRAPADHIFSMQKIPELEIQIIHEVEEVNRANPYNYVLVSQLYMVSKFSSKVETHLGEYLNAVVRGGGVLRTDKLVKLIDGFPVNLGIARCSCTKAPLRPFPAGSTCSAFSSGSTN